jgi:hypothetical protein
MDPISILSGTQAVGRRFSFYIAVQVTSVLAPGIVVIAGSLIVTKIFQHQTSSQSALAAVKELSGAAGLLTSFLLLAAGYVSGYVLRELAFKLLSVVEGLPWLRHKTQVNTFDGVDGQFSSDLIAECFSAHPVLSESRERLNAIKEELKNAESDKRTPTELPMRAGGGHVSDLNFLSFAYAKLWVRNYAPGLSIDSMEAEINILASGFAPSFLVGLGIVAAAHSAWWSVIIGLAIVALVWWVLLNSVIRLRRDERRESVRNLVLDYSMRQAASKYPNIRATDEDQVG